MLQQTREAAKMNALNLVVDTVQVNSVELNDDFLASGFVSLVDAHDREKKTVALVLYSANFDVSDMTEFANEGGLTSEPMIMIDDGCSLVMLSFEVSYSDANPFRCNPMQERYIAHAVLAKLAKVFKAMNE